MMRAVHANIQEAYNPEYTTVKYGDSDVEYLTVSEVLASYEHGDVKELKEGCYAASASPDDAENPDGIPYTKVVKGWKKLSATKKENRVEKDYWNCIGEVEEAYAAEIAKVEHVENACVASGKAAEEAERQEYEEAKKQGITLYERKEKVSS